MLVLTREIDQSINIGSDIKIIIVGLRGDRVRIGIEAPKHIEIHRSEIFEEIQAERKHDAEIVQKNRDLTNVVT